MRVLALGALDVPYIRDNWADALRHVLKEDVTSVNVSAWLACAPPESHLKAVYRLLATGAYDYLFLYHDYIFSDFPDDFFAHVRRTGVRTIAYHPDDEPEVWYQRNRAFDERFDLVASHARRGVARRIAEQRPTNTLYLPWGFNQRFFDKPAAPVAARYDVVFVGKYKVHEHDVTLFCEDGEHRNDALQAVADLCETRGWTFGLFGYGWERHPTLSRFAGGLLSHQEMLRTYHESRIVLNPGWTADNQQNAPQTKLRHFEVPGCGAFQLTNANAELADLFEPTREIVFYQDNSDLCDRVAYYLDHEGERRSIAERGYIRAHREHTLDHRVRTLFSHAARLWAPKRSKEQVRPMPRIATFHARTTGDVAALRHTLAADASPLAHCDLVHVAACDGQPAATHFEGLRDWWRAGVPVFAGRCFYQVPDCARNPLQPQRSEMTGGFLAETTTLAALPNTHREHLPARLPSIVDGHSAHFLINYVARPEAIVALLDAFLANDAEQLEALAPLPTGLVFTEVRLQLPRPIVNGVAKAEPVYVAPLREVLRQAAALDQSVAIYGARGEMATTVFELVKDTPSVRLVALFDRAMAGRQVAGVPVYSAFDLPAVAPDVLLIAAAYSGPAIYEQLKPLEPQMAIVPLYDLRAPAWSVLVPQ